jgi:chromosome segregation ATPase
MTVLGKILVIVNLVFGVIAGGLLIAVFATRTNWKKQNDDLAKEIRVQKAATQTVEDEAAAERKKSAEKLALCENQGKALAHRVATELSLKIDESQTIDKLETELADKIQQEVKKHAKEVAAEKLRADAADRNVESITKVNNRLQEEVDGLQKNLAERNERVNKLLDESKTYRNDYVAADLARKSLQDRNDQLRVQIEGLVKENDQLRRVAGATPGRPVGTPAGDKNPPPEDVRAKVKAVDPGGLITIDKGSDDGINKDNTLEVYRLKDEPKYLGTIRIMAVNAHEAVGRPITPQRRGLIQVGDEVAANILGKR